MDLPSPWGGVIVDPAPRSGMVVVADSSVKNIYRESLTAGNRTTDVLAVRQERFPLLPLVAHACITYYHPPSYTNTI